MLGSALRALLVLGGGAAIVYGASLFGRGAALLAMSGCLLSLGIVLYWLPRVAHKSFRKGRYARARVYYTVLRTVRLSAAIRGSVDVSLAACALSQNNWDRALAILEAVSPKALEDSSRAAWLNNRAYALARSGDDPRLALECSDEAISLRPDVTGFRHTRGIALIALGRLDDAIRELDRLWQELAGDDTKPLLEAERCYDLGVAWHKKGETDYAIDYFERAQRAAPESRWASRAAEELDAPRPNATLADFIEA